MTTIYKSLENNTILDTVNSVATTVTNNASDNMEALPTSDILNVPVDVLKGVSNGALSFADNISFAMYLTFLFYLIGCGICLYFAYDYMLAAYAEKRISKMYGIQRYRFICKCKQAPIVT